MARTFRYDAQERVPKGTRIFRNKKDMAKFLEGLKWREATESAKGKSEAKKIEELHANVLSKAQENKKD